MTERKVNLQVTCCVCNKIHTLKVTEESAIEYKSPNRGLIQNIFPYLNAGERELLISKICPVCWDDMFQPEEFNGIIVDDDDYDESEFEEVIDFVKPIPRGCTVARKS